MAHTTCELIWLKHLLQELNFCELGPMELMCDNLPALYLSSNFIFHERTKHIEVDCYLSKRRSFMASFKLFNELQKSVDWYLHQTSTSTLDWLYMQQTGCIWDICSNLRANVDYSHKYYSLFIITNIVSLVFYFSFLERFSIIYKFVQPHCEIQVIHSKLFKC